MAFEENTLFDRLQAAEARLATMEDQYKPMKERIQEFKANFGVKERSSGAIEIDFEKMVQRLGPEKCLELRAVIDRVWRISGDAGEKPRIRVAAA